MNSEENIRIAEAIREQLGGNQFVAMTGARNFVATLDAKGAGLRFILPRGFARNKSNLVTITLCAGDVYEVRFEKFYNLIVKPISTHERVGADQLRRVFTEETGLDCTL